jgi:hypothetical protein
MDAMGVFAEAFGFTPEEFRAISMEDRRRLVRYLREKQERIEGLRRNRGG